jgi:pSer/pThr/pTyr-binding forkhead associated (FHA) protein
LNGTYVNRERIDEAVLKPGDEVQIGKFKLVYLVAGNE